MAGHRRGWKASYDAGSNHSDFGYLVCFVFTTAGLTFSNTLARAIWLVVAFTSSFCFLCCQAMQSWAALPHTVLNLSLGRPVLWRHHFRVFFFFFFRRLCVVQVVNVISGLWQVLLLVLNKYRYVKYFLSLEMSM